MPNIEEEEFLLGVLRPRYFYQLSCDQKNVNLFESGSKPDGSSDHLKCTLQSLLWEQYSHNRL